MASLASSGKCSLNKTACFRQNMPTAAQSTYCEKQEHKSAEEAPTKQVVLMRHEPF